MAGGRGAPALVVHVTGEAPGPWVDAFAAAFPGWRAFAGYDVPAGAADDVRVAVVWEPPPGFLGRFPDLAHIVSLGTGLDHLGTDPTRRLDIPVLARRDPESHRTMAEFVLLQVLLHHRGVGACLLDRAAKRWDPTVAGPLAGRRVAVLGFGPLARASAELLLSFGCAVTAWSRSAKASDTVTVRAGWDALDDVIAGAGSR